MCELKVKSWHWNYKLKVDTLVPAPEETIVSSGGKVSYKLLKLHLIKIIKLY